MPDLKKFLEKFKHALESNEELKEKISSTIKAETGLLLSKPKISIKNHVLLIETSAASRSEIKLHEKTIIHELKQVGIIVTRIEYR